MKHCLVCNCAVASSVQVFTRCSYCHCDALCMVHRLPEQHSCSFKSSVRYAEKVNALNSELRSNVVRKQI